MALDVTTDFPLLIAGTDCVGNPSFEDWSAGMPVGWATTGSVIEKTWNSGGLSVKGSKYAQLSEVATLRYPATGYFSYTNLGLVSGTFPAWADYFVFCVPIYRVSGTANSTITIQGTSSTSITIPAATGNWEFLIAQLTAIPTGSAYLQISCNTGGVIYVDSVMAGFAIDCPVYFREWNPIPKMKEEKRETPFNMYHQLLSNTFDLKAEFGSFDTAFKSKIVGMMNYLQYGHYFACLLERTSVVGSNPVSTSARFPDEWMPYLSLESQESPKFYAGAPDVFTWSINGRGNMP